MSEVEKQRSWSARCSPPVQVTDQLEAFVAEGSEIGADVPSKVSCAASELDSSVADLGGNLAERWAVDGERRGGEQDASAQHADQDAQDQGCGEWARVG